MFLSAESLTRVSVRRPWWIILMWCFILILAFISTRTLVPNALDGEGGPTVELESATAQNLIDEKFGDASSGQQQSQEQGAEGESEPVETEFVLITSESVLITDDAFQQAIQSFGEVLDEAAGSLVVGSLSDYQAIPSRDQTTVMYRVNIHKDQTSEIHLLTHAASDFSGDQFKVLVFGNASINTAFQERAERDLLVGESIGIGVALVILALVFGAVVAGLIPILLAIACVFTAIGLTGIVGEFVELNEFVPNIITMMGLAVGIDYSLFVLSRYREERGNGLSKDDAIVRSGSTASRAVFFSGATVVLALTGLLLIPESFFQAFGSGAIVVVFVSVVACLTLLPALISILGDRVNSVRVPGIPIVVLFLAGVALVPDRTEPGRVMLVAFAVIGLLFVSALIKKFFGFGIPLLSPKPSSNSSDEGGFWDRVTRAVMRQPILSALVSTAILVVLIIPFFDLEKGTSGISVLPDEEPAKQAFELLNTKYGFGSNSPALVVVSGNVGSQAVIESIDKLKVLMKEDSGVQEPEVQSVPDVQLAVLTAPVPGDPFSQVALDTIRRLRADLVPQAFQGVSSSDYEVFVGGASAEIVDQVKLTDDYTPRVFGAVLGLSFLLLLVAFRSLVIPIASIFMNLLSVGAAYGLVVLVFQKGFLINIFGFQRMDQIEFWLPLFMFSILFGLSMDYHVFMLSRIKEHFDETRDQPESVAFGLRTTARIITGAALIMVAVFGGFALGDIAFFQSMGFGLGSAILLDATIVRSMLVPAVLRILGNASWYYPAALNWIPNISIEGNPSDTPSSESSSEGPV